MTTLVEVSTRCQACGYEGPWYEVGPDGEPTGMGYDPEKVDKALEEPCPKCGGPMELYKVPVD